MKFLGLLLLIVGIVSLTLELFGANLLVLSWANQWGTTAGWAIRIGITLLGAVLYYVNRNDD